MTQFTFPVWHAATLCGAILISMLGGCTAPYDAQSTRFGDIPDYHPNYRQVIPAPQPYGQPVSATTVICCRAPQALALYQPLFGYAPQHNEPPVIRRRITQRRAVRSAFTGHIASAALLPAATEIATPAAGITPKTYVRLKGRTSINDWHDCELIAGDYSGPEFERCMRSKSYVPEAEALSILDARETG